jgi:hypothetical protein
MNLRVTYSCPNCELQNVAIDVSARGDEDVDTFMKNTIMAVTKDHYRRNPGCRPATLPDIAIPHDDRMQRIGTLMTR